MVCGGGAWAGPYRELHSIHNIFQEDEQTEREKSKQYKFLLLLFCECVSAMWYFKPNNMYGSAKLTDTKYHILLGYFMT